MLRPFTWVILLLGSVVFTTASAFDAFYAFGDGVCTTTSNNPAVPSLYYGHRESNGRVWIEVLAQRQGLPYDPTKNQSYFGNFSTMLLANLNHFTAPANASNALFAVWVCDADFVSDIQNIYPSVNVTNWNSAVQASLTNHFAVITNLYAKGVRTLILPNAVDITEVPYYNQIVSASDRGFVRGRVIYFNTNFLTTINQAKKLCPGLTVVVPDIFNLLDNVLTNAASYGLTNALYLGQPIDAVEALANVATNGPGTNYVFWDYQDPTAKFHAVIADYIQQLVSPVQVGQLIPLAGSNGVAIANVPVGLNGVVESLTNLAATNWAGVKSFSSTNVTQSVFVPAASAGQFYRLRFPYAWSWP